MKLTKQINIGGVRVGGGAPIAIQSMTNTDTRDAKATLARHGTTSWGKSEAKRS